MARQQAPPPVVASPPPTSSRITKSRSEASRPSAAQVSRRNVLLSEASSSGMLQEMLRDASQPDSSDEDVDVAEDQSLGVPNDSNPTGNEITEFTMVDSERETAAPSSHTNNECPIIDKDERPFPIMDLPTEIRLEIYRACLTRPYNILLSKNERRPPVPTMDDKDAEATDSLPFIQQALNDAFDANVRTAQPSRESSALPETRDDTAAYVNANQILRRRRSYGDRILATVHVRTSNQFPIANRAITTTATLQDNSSGPAAGHAGPSHAANLQSADGDEHTYHRIWIQEHLGPRIDLPAFMPYRPQSQDPLLVNLLLANKQIYKEARSVLYSENLFTLDLSTAISTLQCLHQRSRRQIKHVELEIPTYNEILEKFQETVRLSLRYCSGLKKLIIHMPFTLPGADGSGTTGNTTVYANGFDILRWLPQQCAVLLRGNSCDEIDSVVNKHLALAKTLDKLAYARRQLISSDNSHLQVAIPETTGLFPWL